MRLRLPTWGAAAGTLLALASLVVVSLVLLNSGGANYRVLVAVWLWLLPVTGLFAGLGYAVGTIIQVIAGAKASPEKGGTHADAR